MKKKNESKMAAVLVTMGLCVVALGAGMTYYTWSNVKEPLTAEERPVSPVTAAKSPTLDTAKAQREQMSNDDGEAPDPEVAQEAKTTKTTTSEKKTTEKATEKAQQTVTYAYPVTGETVMPYSVDKAVYDPTLDQYRTNDTLCIAAEAGTEVKAAADGTVAEIKEDDESGRTLVVEHADGTRTTYGPLMAEGMAKKGDTVTKGQTVGKLDQPTKYQAALGSHLVFAMEVQGERVDPTKKLEK
ncbi:peptidoglycan DD-metalloendopeptidase family protein [Anaerotignum sp.]|uniref:peptidoglycan DD-metalloendopeptidase family protein n=1 Tax=Anaerotignum sp. TaxID=2039241 RepID=UPI003735BE54